MELLTEGFGGELLTEGFGGDRAVGMVTEWVAVLWVGINNLQWFGLAFLHSRFCCSPLTGPHPLHDHTHLE